MPNDLGNMTHFWCSVCNAIQPATFEGAVFDTEDGQYIGGDVICSECYFVIATAYREKKSS